MPNDSSPDERRHFILNSLNEKGRLSTAELSSHFAMSEDSARRDFRQLASEGLIQRVHGAALPASSASEPFASRYKVASNTKKRLAKLAASMVLPGQVILFDGGTTTLSIASQIPVTLAFSAITNSPQLASALSGHHNVEVILLGGVFDHRSQMTCGTSVLSSVQKINADICFFGVHGIDGQHGLTTPYYDEAPIKAAMIAAASETIAVATRDKIGIAAPHKIGPVNILDTLITEAAVDRVHCDAIAQQGVQVKLG